MLHELCCEGLSKNDGFHEHWVPSTSSTSDFVILVIIVLVQLMVNPGMKALPRCTT